MRHVRLPILALLACLLMLGGCSLWQDMNRPVENAEAQAKVQQVEDGLATLKGYVASLMAELTKAQAYIAEQDEKLAQARALAEQSHSDAALAVVAGIERIRDEAMAGIPALKDTLATFQAKVPVGEKILAQMKEDAAKLPAGGSSPLWYVLGTMALPFLIRGTQAATAGIPGIGPVVSMGAEAAIKGLWNTMATARLKAQDAENEAKAKALEHQVQVTNDLVKAAGDKAAPILKAAKNAQIVAGVHATLDPIVAAVEAKG